MFSLAKSCRPGLFVLLFLCGGVAADETAGDCAAHVGRWLDPNSGEEVASSAIFERLSGSRIVLLGESHTSAAHHRWQAYMLAALHSRNASMMVGFEMLPRRAQPALDAWSRGELSESGLLEQTEWRRVWGYDAEYYLPLLHFARLNRLPALALNIDRELVAKVGDKGWHGVAESERMGISTPAPASDDYRESLAQIYALKQSMRAEEEGGSGGSPDIDEILASEEFDRFVDAQLTWDRAMAEALAAAHRRDPKALVVGIVGRGHAEFGHGIPHQLADMGIGAVDVLLPIDADDECNPLPMDLASAVFVVDAEAEGGSASKPRLGVVIEGGDGGVSVIEVVDDSVARAAGIEDGDLIVKAAGFEVETSAELIEVIQRQAPGTWLPLEIRRDGKLLELIARFPQSFE